MSIISKNIKEIFYKLNIDSMWTLYLDRDGVINKQILNGYVTDKSQFILTDFIIDNICYFTSKFNHIIIVTNQQGVGKGIMTENALIEVNRYMVKQLKKLGGRVDKIYYCTDLKSSNSLRRKPQVGMGNESLKDFPSINKQKSIMIGDSNSDVLFAKNFGIIFIKYVHKNNKFQGLELFY
jgi:histidinol-phosphate phosphatase family protein